MGLLQLLKSLFGQKYLNKIIGTRTNVAKPIQMDKSSPFRRYTDAAYDDPEIVALIEKKIDEYGPYALNNKNPQELANFEDNAKRLLAAKNKQTGTTEGMKKSMEPKPEAEMFEFETKQKLDDKGIMTLKEDMGLPPDVAPDSPMGKILTSRNKINQQFKGMGKAAQDIAAKSYSTAIEGKRRAAMRQILLRDKRIKLTLAEEESLEDMLDLGKNADPTMDPLVLFDKFYKRDNKKLEMLDGIIDESLNPVDAADNFLVKDDTIELLDDDLGTKLKDYDGDPDGLAEGGRIGFASGGIKALIAMMNKKFGKDAVKTADKIDRPESALNRDMFGAFEDRLNRQILDVPETPSGFKLSRERLLKNYPEIDESFADEIMTMDRDMQIRIIEMLKDRRKDPKAYDKLLMEKGDTLDFQGEFDRSVQRDKNADGGLNYLMGL